MNLSREAIANRAARRRSRERPPSFAWQAVLILLPVAVLTAVGLYSLRQDRLLAEQEARDRAGRIAQTVLDRAVGPLFEENPVPPSDTIVVPGVDLYRPVFEVTPEAELVWPPPVDSPPTPRPLDPSELAAAARDAWQSAQRVASAGEAAKAAEGWGRFLATEPPADFAACAQYEWAQAELRLGQTNQALARLAQLAATRLEVTLESGLPLAPLAVWKATELELCQTTNANQRGALVQRACSNLVFHPTALSPELLRRVQSLAGLDDREDGHTPPGPLTARALHTPWSGSESLRAWWRLWDTTQRARDLFAATRAQWRQRGLLTTNLVAAPSPLPSPQPDSAAGLHRVGERVALPAPIWVEVPDPEGAPAGDSGCSSAMWLVTRFPASSPRFHGWSECEVTNLLARVRRQLPELPPYFDLTIALAGRTFPMPSPLPLLAERAANGAAQPAAGPPALSVRVHLADAAALYAHQRLRTWWFMAVVLAAAATAGVGLLAAHRAFQRQLRLNELKSNFVSSVSHELRAPIASVRLLAESLDRGKVTDETKRRDYFRLIGQECRRLSSLVENVLDFSRIDQGRKQYAFEPTDLVALVTQTVKLMEPYAAERQVTLQLDQPSTLDHQPSLDGKALQQALVNLIDNAVKHAPAGTAVVVALSTSSLTEPEGVSSSRTSDAPSRLTPHESRITNHESRLTLSVTDRGSGIPPAEHARIFEPFYRRGSELRRETTGVGIGLSIVQHVVEAHGGRVRVESDVGKGSRFTIELPVATTVVERQT